MNDLGLMLAWSAVQVSLLLIPAAAIYVPASRRSPASGAWVAALGLALVVVLSLLTPTVPGRPHPHSRPPTGVIPARPVASSGQSRAVPVVEPRPHLDPRAGWSLEPLRAAWMRLESTAAVPAMRVRHWGRSLAVFALAGMGVGFLHLSLGLWAVQLGLRRSRRVDDPALAGLIGELQGLLGCRKRIEVRELSDLTTPATAGWWRVAVLLPGDWRTWDEPERRAVLAHELAHVCRADYVTGVVARLALVIHFYHPLVHWLAARLQLDQELAADALGARFAGGRSRYLLSLSRLALRQDGRSRCWPARAFLPAKRILIRRIAMLRDERVSKDRPWSALWRGLSASLLLALFGGVLTLRGPARGDDAARSDGEVKPVSRVLPPDGKFELEPFDLTYLPDEIQGFVGLRPAATFRRAGMAAYRDMLNLVIAQEWSKAANGFGFDPAQPGLGAPRVEMFEQVLSLVSIDDKGLQAPRWRLMAGDVVSARTTDPLDWLRLVRAFKRELTEAREGDHVYYKWDMPELGPNACIYVPDDRTIVFAGEPQMLRLLRRRAPNPSVFAKAKGWDRALRGLLLLAYESPDDRLGRLFQDVAPDEIDLAPLFRQASRWTFDLGSGDEIELHAVATFPDGGASEAAVRTGQTVLKSLRGDLRWTFPGTPAGKDAEHARRMLRSLLTNGRVDRDEASVVFRATGLGAIADLASLIAAGGW